MPGGIVGIYGAQRSGKTLVSYLISQYIYDFYQTELHEKPRVYTNLYVLPNDDMEVTYVNAIKDIPLDMDPKIILLDEIYNGCDANDFRKLKDISIFVNTIGKQNALLLYTSIDDSMVYNRIRNQCNLVILVKKFHKEIFYRTVDPNTLSVHDYKVDMCPELFRRVHYDTNFIPLIFDWRMDEWQGKLRAFYKDNFDIKLSEDYFKV
ncbi:MAG: ATP-binding protein [Lachnospiraceae bacterium]|nr:ATP-binding protein [Lachnospiraceae bacterium]